MPISDALVVGEDWISEHYFTTDATKESFQGRVIERRKTWDAEAAEEHATTRSRFLAARGDLEMRLVAVSEGLATDSGGESEAAEAARRPLTPQQRAAVDELYDVLLDVLGYRTASSR